MEQFQKNRFFTDIQQELINFPKRWLITGVAGFIGSNILEALLKLDQFVTGIDNFSTGYERNLEEVKSTVTPDQWSRFKLFSGDVTDYQVCRSGVENVDYVLHQAALGSVPRSIKDPIASNKANVTGFLNILDASRRQNVSSFIFASSSSVYGDIKDSPKLEQMLGRPLSPYAVTKKINETYADIYGRTYGFNSIGLRYFNVFGPRQDPDGQYAAVIPKWISAMTSDQSITINGSGDITRDFSYIDNIVQANILAATTQNLDKPLFINIACGRKTSLFELHKILSMAFNYGKAPVVGSPRAGDVQHSLASVELARQTIGYLPNTHIEQGIELLARYINKNT